MDFTDRVVVTTSVFNKNADCFTETGKKMMDEFAFKYVPIHFMLDDHNGICFYFDEYFNSPMEPT
jgi:hypothetical protein